MKKKIPIPRTVIAIFFATMFVQAVSAQSFDVRRTVGVYAGTGQASPVATAALSEAGYRIVSVSADEAAAGGVVAPDKFFLYVIPDAQKYPAAGFGQLRKFLAGNGNLVTIGGPAFTRPIYKITTGTNSTWCDQEVYEDRINQTKAEQVVFSFESPLDWSLEAGDPKLTGGEISLAAGGVKGQCLAYKIANLIGFASYRTTIAAGAFSAGNNLLCLWAKGDEQTKVILLEIDEADGSRWMYVLPVTSEWKNYAVFFDDFVYWHDSVTKDQRGQLGNHLNPTRAMLLKVGLAETHTPVSGGKHCFWIDELGSAKGPLPNFKQATPPPSIETISPKYKIYPLAGITALKAAASGTAFNGPNIGGNLWSPVRRPQGFGYTGQNPWRWIPLVNAFAGDELRGSVASLVINNAGSTAGSICASFGTDALDVPMAKVLANTAKRIEDGLFLTEAGSEYFSYYGGETAKLGARVMNGGDGDRAVSVRMQVAVGGKQVWHEEKSVSVKAHGVATAEFSWPVTAPKGFTVRAELLCDGKPVDAIEHAAGILPNKNKVPAADEFVTAKGSDFYCQGKKWYPIGVNYWPSYIAGFDGDAYWGKWLAPGYYNPEGIEADLVRMQKLGLNMTSIMLKPDPKDETSLLNPAHVRNTLDFLRRCGEHGIKVNGLLPNAAPLQLDDEKPFNESLVATYIQQANLANNPVLFAYDTIWEPGYRAFNDEGRKAMNPHWNKWIVERYGSAENAIADWGFTPEFSNGVVSPPQAVQMTTGDAWRIYIAAYRRFMDDFTSKSWQTAHRKIKAHDPHHLISYRQGNSALVDFGLTGPVKHLDFVSPEAYSFPFNADGADCAGFATRYIHFTSGGKPVYWAEFGSSVWDLTTTQPDPLLITNQGSYIREIYKMTLESGANGLAPWWWPGGFRADENSDYGINNPDGTPRPAARAAREFASRLKTARDYPAPDKWFIMDRDTQAGGYCTIILNAGREAYRQARAAGKNLGVKTAGTGTDSANTPMVAVGNVSYNGHNPPKYLNAEFNSVSVQAADGRWVEIFEIGQSIEVAAGQPVRVKASIGNLGEATWLAPTQHSGAGGVYLASRSGDVTFREPILADTAYLKDASTAEFTLTQGVQTKTEIVFEMTALDRMWFGEKFTLTLLPK